SLCDVRDEAVRPWSSGFSGWQPGEAGANERLERFVSGPLGDYAQARDRPDRPGTSRLSPHLHFGEVSARAVWHAVTDAALVGDDDGPEAFLRQLAWREFARQLLLEHPYTTSGPLRPELGSFPWNDDPDALAAWQQGRTGYPIVDAGMRQLWQTGWMHNRVRLVCASLLCKHLLIPWQRGARWFWETLLDADLADNTLGWQWVAGSGADAAPYFRIFNPASQGRRYDPDGVYVRRWLPELAGLPDAVIHAPWEASAARRRAAGVRLIPPGEAAALSTSGPGPRLHTEGVYPEPFIDHAPARRRALDAFATMRERARA
ncbi:MAG: deoxyribodipyrimidine photo-lyase, partial [Actinobacteria bacterium]|nr:deoxyribodipyrimidine photo-lyase [Actinomycetota bacterium]